MHDEPSWTTWPAPAKLNLFLHIVGRRADGYHELQTLFQLLDFADVVQLRVREDGAIVRAQEVLGVPMETDLSLRAAHLLKQHTGCALGVEVMVDKRIPIGGGLGGGSSDAATVLVALNALWQTKLKIEALAELGLQLGADVPVFVHGATAWAEGVGERLTPITLPERAFVIVDPGVFVPTSALFQAPELTRNAPQMTIPLFHSGAKTVNVFEPVVRARYKGVAAALDWLALFGSPRLSGSGGCVFLALPTRNEAVAVARQCPPQFSAYVAVGVNHSALKCAVERVSAGTSPSW